MQAKPIIHKRSIITLTTLQSRKLFFGLFFYINDDDDSLHSWSVGKGWGAGGTPGPPPLKNVNQSKLLTWENRAKSIPIITQEPTGLLFENLTYKFTCATNKMAANKQAL